jgi:ribosome-associated protein
MSEKRFTRKSVRAQQPIEEFAELDARPSKSERKREMQALQELGENIVGLSAGEFASIPLEGLLLEAITLARRLPNREGLRRQLQYIGKLMRESDVEAIATAYDELLNGRQLLNQKFHQLEQMRDRLLAEGLDAIAVVLDEYPLADRQHLRQLIAAAVKEREQNKPPAAARKLFKYLRELAEL